MRGWEEPKRELFLTLWLLCLLAPNVQKSRAKHIVLKGPGTTAKSRKDGDRRRREEGGKGQFFFREGDWTVDSPSVCFFLFLRLKGGREWNTGEIALMKFIPIKKDQILLLVFQRMS